MFNLGRKLNYRAFSTSAAKLQKLEGQTCVISGGSRGIGLAVAERFANEGGRCVLIGRNGASLQSALEKLDSDIKLGHSYKVGDVKSRSFWQELSSEIKNVDVLVNAAGVAHDSLLVTTRAEQVENVLDTNLKGSIWACQILAKAMLRRKSGCIINVGSLLGSRGGKGSVVYAASKAGLLGLTRSLASELGQSGIRINAIVPGYIDTEMVASMPPVSKQQALDSIPSKKLGRPEDISDAVLFLATNPYANNCVLNLDGGLSAA